MKIPDAYFGGGLGQRVAQPAPALHTDASGDVAVGQAAQLLGQNLLQTATDQNEFQGRIDLQQAHDLKAEMERKQREQEAELKAQAKERELAAAKREYLNFAPQLSALQQKIVDDPDTAPEDYPAAFRDQAQKLASDTLYPKLNEHQRNTIESQVMEHINQGSEQIYKTGQQEINDGAWAESIATLDALKNDPTKDVRTKIAIIKDDNFFGDTGRPAHDIEDTRQKAIQEIITEDAAHRFNALKPNTKAKDPIKASLSMLDTFRQQITATDANGQYTYNPEWDQKTREEYVSMALAKKQALEAQAEQLRRERDTQAKQEATNLVMELKDKVKTGWIPTTAADYKFVATVRKYSALSPSLSRQYSDAMSYTTDFGKRMELKKADPLGVAAAEHGVQLPALNMLDVTNLPKQIAGRLAVAKQLGVNAVFRGDEIKALSEYLQTLPARDQVKLISTISRPLGPAISSATFNSAAEQVRLAHPDQAVMFKLYASGKPAEAQLYAEGRSYLNGEKKDFLKDKFGAIQQDMTDRINKQLGSALAAMPEARNTTRDAVATVYLAEAQRRNAPLDSVDKDLLTDVVRRVAGNTVHTGAAYFGSGKTTIVPDGMNGDQFLNSIKAITPKDIAKRGGIDGMNDADAARFLKSSAWHEWNGGYTFVRDGKPLYGKSGRPFVFRLDDGIGAR
ncbi:hypothetical protein F6V25_08000 [Oryzomonas japonica]|uniref:Uncharacterized protein n=1 Tax=Oryzomonas japonica TaxID=2603858 RepID=A0A7J4ZRR3_9BACT|nr:hypothetical protein [Oryzomonas japonica]KAB0665655.1 hypothetical protein F6V25_08000 [Oryzomonas japonica]